MKLEGKVAIITGASRGIGKAEAIGFAKEGAAVVIAARTEQEKVEVLPGTIYETAEEVQGVGGRALPVRCDITREEDVEAMVQRVLDEFGRVDILINNATVAFPGPLWELPAKRWNVVLGVNLNGTFLCTKAVLPTMMKQRSGSIINTSSPDADSRTKAVVGIAYGVAKTAIEHFTFAAAAELGEYNIAVNCFKPARIIATPGGLLSLPPELDRSQFIGPGDMVKAAIFLATQDAKGVTGLVATVEEIIAWHGL